MVVNLELSAIIAKLLLLLLFHWFRFVPVSSHFHLDFYWYIKPGHALHHGFYQPFDSLKLLDSDLEDKLIMHLKNHSRLQFPLLEFILDANHCYFNQVSIAPLNWNIDGFTFKCLTLIKGQCPHFWEEALPS